MELRNYSETGEPWNSEITPKLLRNCSETEDRGIPKLLRNYGTGTVAVELWNYSEITPKLGNRGTMELLRSYTEITPKLLWLAIVLY